MMGKLDDARLIDLPTVEDASGNLTVVEDGGSLPFDLRRTYFLHGLSDSSQRGHHAHIHQQEIIVAAHGSFQVTVEGLAGRRRPYKLSNPRVGLYLPSMLWRELSCFSSDAICLVFCSHPYAESDYIRDYPSYRSFEDPSA